jgi:predicted amidohydrolase YtcJ
MPELLVNGRITTLDDAEAPEALVVDGKLIAFSGARKDAAAFAAARGDTQVTDLGGRCVVPGLIDMHAHLDREGLKQSHPAMTGLRSRRDVLQRIEDLARASRPGDWIVTMPIGEPPFYFFATPADEAALYPTRHELDEAAPANPVYIRPILGFWRWSPLPETLVSAANSVALAAAGLTDATPPPATSVELERDALGRLTGRFFERTTASLLELIHFAHPTGYRAADRVAALRASQAAALSAGVTTVFEGHGVEPAVLAAYKALHENEELAIRAELAFSPSWSSAAPAAPAAIVERSLAWLGGAGRGDDRLRIRGLFINPHSAPDDAARARAGGYTGMAGYHFDSGLAADDAVAVLQACVRAGIRAVGLSTALYPLFDRAGNGGDISGLGWLIQHCSHVTEENAAIARRHRIGLTFLPVEAIYKQAPLAHADPARARDWMPLRRLIDAGQPVSFASDNIPPSLFFAIWCSLARLDYRGQELPDPDGAISRADALRIATMGAAQCLGRADRLGSLRAGKQADLAVLDRDYFSCPLHEIPEIRAVAAMVDGVWRHGDPNLFDDPRNRDSGSKPQIKLPRGHSSCRS